ncbi:MAG: glycosyltransferase family 2 protein, partial [Desulfomonilia bacterium]|nr:glycosyltransferase family 2 protein [Desulfomonilia bacterium]
MYQGNKVVVVMPAYNAEKTLRQSYDEVMAQGIVDLVIIVDDKSADDTVSVARKLPHAQVHLHEQNLGYGANQKTCYRPALDLDADIVVMLHPDYQYSPKLLVAMSSLVAYGEYDVVLGS